MRLPVEWIREYAAVEADAEAIAETLTMAGLEVEEKAESARGAVLDIKVTPNRGDCLSAMGVARELSAAYSVPLRPPSGAQSSGPGEAASLAEVEIEAPDLCPRYAARIVRNLKRGASPSWMQERLEAAGMRPINNIVDVTNYVMLETGQPLHAFDYDTLTGHRIVVRRARAGEKLTTLDTEERDLTPDMLVIADAERPVAIAGVMGGAETEMTASTRTLLLESAHFYSLSVRRTARTLGMRTEASYRFERTVDPAGVAFAADRACQLISDLGMGEVVPGIIDIHPGAAPQRVLDVRPARVSAMLGFDVSCEQVADTLIRLGFAIPDQSEIRNPNSAIAVTVPSWRSDITREIDLVEEVGRVLGYQHIPERLPVGVTLQGGDSPTGRFVERVREVLAGCGLQEIVSHSLIAPNPLDEGSAAPARVPIRSALSAELSGLRQSLLAGLVDAVERNLRRGSSPLAFFEIGHIFYVTDGTYREGLSIGGALLGPMTPTSWADDGSEGSADFYTGRGIVAHLARAVGCAEPRFIPLDGLDPRLHSGRQAVISLDHPNGFPVTSGVVGELHPRLTADLRTRDRVVVFELICDVLKAAATGSARFTPLSDYPAVTRDLAPRVDARLAYSQIHRAVTEADVAILEEFRLTNLFTGPPLPEGMKSLTLSFTLRAPDRTLTESEVNDAMAQIRSSLEATCGASFVG